MLKKTVPSPCVRNCCLDHNDICLGCGRHLLEIQQWQEASDARRLDIIAAAQQRVQQRIQQQRALRQRTFPST